VIKPANFSLYISTFPQRSSVPNFSTNSASPANFTAKMCSEMNLWQLESERSKLATNQSLDLDLMPSLRENNYDNTMIDVVQLKK
jgi:hypothetical protein